MKTRILFLLLLFAACPALFPDETEDGPSPDSVFTGDMFSTGTEGEVLSLDIPDLEKRPRFMRSRSPWYGIITISPYVGQMGILASSDRADSGFGYGIAGGYSFPLFGTTSLGIEFHYEQSKHHNAASDVDGTATRLGGGLRMNFSIDEDISPFAIAGAGTYSLDFAELDSKFSLSGLGFYAGGGSDFSVNEYLTIRAEACMHVWDAAESSGNGGMANTLALTVGFNFSF